MHSATKNAHTKDREREHAESFAKFLFCCAWLFYIASLFLPAMSAESTYAKPGDSDLRGWEIVRFVTLGWFLSPYFLLYFYVNLIFWLSAWRWFVQCPRDAVSAFYVVNLFVATAVAWHAHRTVDEVYFGYYFWAVSLTLLTFAFSVPRASPET